MLVILSQRPIYGSSLMVRVKYEDWPRDGGGGGGEYGIVAEETEKVMVMVMVMAMAMAMARDCFHHCQVSVAM